jgi:hypothetical protein
MIEILNENRVKAGDDLHPKTFHVMIRRPFGFLVSHGISMYVHGDTWQDVLEWIESTFPGVDTGPTVIRKNAVPGILPRIGNADPVVINDVDLFGITKREGGKIVRLKAPEGHWRHSAEDVANDLFKVSTLLREQSEALTRSFHGLRDQYERGNTQDWAYDRLLEMKTSIERADVWQDNVWRQYCEARPQRGLDMPDRRI